MGITVTSAHSGVRLTNVALCVDCLMHEIQKLFSVYHIFVGHSSYVDIKRVTCHLLLVDDGLLK